MLQKKIIAAVRGKIDKAVKSDVNIIFFLSPNILNIKGIIDEAHNSGKKIFLHFDLAEGIGKDKAGLEFIKKLGADGIISTRVNIIKAAREVGLATVQRFFIVDSHSIETTAEALKASKPDLVELMPGIITKVITEIKEKVDIPVIAGGLIETEREAAAAFEAGASAVSTGKPKLWKVFE